MSKDGGCCSLECGAKTIGWLQVVCGSLMILVMFVNLATLMSTDIDAEIEINIKTNDTNLAGNMTRLLSEETMRLRTEAESARTVAIISYIIFILFFLVLIGLAGALLTGIRKRKPKLIWLWIVATAVGCGLEAGTILLQLGSMLLATDPGSITNQIIVLVLHCLQLWVVYIYYQEAKDDFPPAY